MDFAHDELSAAIQATAQRVAQDVAAASAAQRVEVGRRAVTQAGLLELTASGEGAEDDAPGAEALCVALHTLALGDTGLALFVWAQNLAQAAAGVRAPELAQAFRDGSALAVPLDLELESGQGFHVSASASRGLRLDASAARVHAGAAGQRTSVGVDGADMGVYETTGEGITLDAPDIALFVAGLACIAAGVAQRATRASVGYALVRQQFGHPIADFQAIQFMIADSQVGADAARLVAFGAAAQGDLAASARALSCAAGAARVAADVAVQVHGGGGYTRDYPAEALLRDASVFEHVASRRLVASALAH